MARTKKKKDPEDPKRREMPGPSSRVFLIGAKLKYASIRLSVSLSKSPSDLSHIDHVDLAADY